jgi:hypothetical protein
MPVIYKKIFSATIETIKKPRNAYVSTPKTKKKIVKKTKDKKNEQPEVASKKRGRPSNAELAIKAREKRDAEKTIRQELIERQKAAAEAGVTTSGSATVQYDENDEPIHPEYKTDFTSKIKDPNWIPPWPIFMPGQAVYTEMYGIRYEGTVGYDNVESAMIRVNWKDGSSQFAAKMNLKPILKKTYKKIFSARRSKNEGE